MNNLLVKFFAYADMLFMTAFILAVLIGDIKWFSVTTSIALLAFGIAGVTHALLTRNGRPQNYIYVCGLDALVGLVAVILGVTTGWWN